MARLSLVGFLLVALAAFACGDGAGEGGADAGPGGGGATYDELDAELQELFDLINEEREAAGVSPVALRGDLVCAAQVHSDDIGDTQTCSHDGSDGSEFPDRVRACDGDSVTAETVACGQQSPRAAVDGWLNSPPHRDIMLGAGRRHVGIGVHQNYWTAVYDD